MDRRISVDPGRSWHGFVVGPLPRDPTPPFRLVSTIPISTAAEDARSQLLYISPEFLIRFVDAPRRGFLSAPRGRLRADNGDDDGEW